MIAPRVRTRGLVLRKIPYGESSWILSLFTYHLGKLKVLVKGAKRPKSRFVSTFETFHVVEVVVGVKETREIQHVYEARTLVTLPELRTSYAKQVWASRLVRAIELLVPGRAQSRGLYSLTERSLFLMVKEGHEESVFLAFLLKALRTLGYPPTLDRCVVCGRRVPRHLSPRRGGAVCSACGEHEPVLIYLPESGIRTLQALYGSSLGVATQVPDPGLLEPVLRYAEWVTGIDGLTERILGPSPPPAAPAG